MKKILAIALCVLFAMTMVACTGGAEQNTNSAADDSSVTDTESTSESSEWKQFLKDYEAWVDDYIVIVNKYKANPTDTSILADYTKMVSDMADWTTRTEKVQEELTTDSEALAEYTKELSRIAGKLAEVAQ